MSVVRREPVKSDRTGIYVMPQLFGDIRLMRFLLAFVSSAAVVCRMMVLHRDLAIRTGLEKEPCARGRTAQLRYFAVSVVVAVVRAAGTMGSKDIRTYFAAVTHDRTVQTGVDIISGMLVDIAYIGYIDEIAHRLLGDDIHHAGDGVGSIYSRSAAAHHLYTVDHGSRHLL